MASCYLKRQLALSAFVGRRQRVDQLERIRQVVKRLGVG